MLLHSRPSPVPVIDSDRDDWWRHARCANAADRDMWTADDVWVRVAAAHQCISHCPVLARCHREAQEHTWRGTAIGGVVYGHDGLPVDIEAPRHCPTCAPDELYGIERRRQQWREAAYRARGRALSTALSTEGRSCVGQ